MIHRNGWRQSRSSLYTVSLIIIRLKEQKEENSNDDTNTSFGETQIQPFMEQVDGTVKLQNSTEWLSYIYIMPWYSLSHQPGTSHKPQFCIWFFAIFSEISQWILVGCDS